MVLFSRVSGLKHVARYRPLPYNAGSLRQGTSLVPRGANAFTLEGNEISGN